MVQINDVLHASSEDLSGGVTARYLWKVRAALSTTPYRQDDLEVVVLLLQ